MSEPEFISQTAEDATSVEAMIWFRAKAEEATAQGATFHRFSKWTKDPDQPDILLYEGWKIRPDEQGDPRFQMCATR